MKKINKTLYAFITFALMWIIIALPNNTLFIENWDISGIAALFSFYISTLFIILPMPINNFEKIWKLIFPLMLSTICVYIIISLCNLHFNCITWDKNIKIFFCGITLVVNSFVTIISLFSNLWVKE